MKQQEPKGPPPPPSKEDVRLAVSHLAEMAAAYEGAGLGFKLGPGSESPLEHFGLDHLVGVEEDDGGDLEMFSFVVDKLVRHRRDQRRKQRDIAIRALSEMLNQHVRNYLDDNSQTREELMKQIDASFRLVGVALDQKQLDTLTPQSRTAARELSVEEEDEDTAPAWGGPAETMKRRLARLLALGPRSIGNYRADNNPLKTMRRHFGRWVPIKTWVEYLLGIAAHQLTFTPKDLVGVEDFGNCTEAFGLRHDRRLEDQLRRLANDWDMLIAVQPERVRVLLRNEVEMCRVKLRASLYDRRGARLPPSSVPPRLQAAIDREGTAGTDAAVADESAIEKLARAEVMARAARSILPLLGEEG